MAVAIASASADLGLALGLDGRHAEAARFVDQALAVLRDAGVPRELAIGLRAKGTLAFLQGHPREAAALLTDALAICRTLGDRILEGDTLESIGLVLADTDRPHAREAAAEGLRLHESAGYPRGIAKGLAVLGSLACADGDVARGEEQLQRALALLASLGERVYVSYCLVHLATAAASRGDEPEAARLAAAAQVSSDRGGGAMFPFVAARHRALVDRIRTSLGASPFDRAWAAGAALTVQDLAANGAAPAAARAGGDPPAGELTSREAEVLALVAGGLPDAEIAGRLFVSARTVHAHLRSIYGKLGVPNRTAAARYAIAHGLVASVPDERDPA